MRTPGAFLLLSLALFCFFSDQNQDNEEDCDDENGHDANIACSLIEHTLDSRHCVKDFIYYFQYTYTSLAKTCSIDLSGILQSSFEVRHTKSFSIIKQMIGHYYADESRVDCGEFRDPKVYCTRESNPHCGSDGQTYGNKCAFCKAVAKSSGKISLKHHGKC
ncbi:double-headed protease inhibitor, submandibular gland-like [Echinops telfairi]|uniref:Double-headed protease inhibitor, submandibular gland-like n=1 Tax=Echinops telfairi TaxID=9371 RepID=A0AC55CMK9_ECHTE|nr:double-headed protease inhibitor, submandibular gland-like [Echinops telfairi]